MIDLDAIEARARAVPIDVIPTRLTLPNDTVAEVVSVQVRYTLPTGGSWHESMSVATWRRQEDGREVSLDGARGGDREG